jgi:hypothetical protein
MSPKVTLKLRSLDVAPPIGTDRNLLFGVLALKADRIDCRKFIDACTLWTTRKSVLLADVLVENGWLLPADKTHVDYLVDRELQRHGGSRIHFLSLIGIDPATDAN